MKRRAQKVASRARRRHLKRSNDRHDRWLVFAFMRACIETLAREDIGVDQKIHTVAGIAHRLAPSIKAARKGERTT